MIGLFFEVTPRPGHEQAYFDIAAGLRPELDKNPGLLFIDRFKSLTTPRIILSHSHWRDEASLAGWRTQAKHHVAQVAGRQQHFEDYRLRIAQRIWEWRPDAGIGRGSTDNSYNDPQLQPERFLIAATATSEAACGRDGEVLSSVYRDNEFILLKAAASLAEGLVLAEALSAAGQMTSVRLFLVSRDYGMYDRREAPQYYPPVARDR